jgi:hypothetical protein
MLDMWVVAFHLFSWSRSAKMLLSLERKGSPFSAELKPNGDVHWVSPKLVCEVKFWRMDQRWQMRQPILWVCAPIKRQLQLSENCQEGDSIE